MTTAFDLFAVGPEVISLERVATAYDRGGVPTFGDLARIRTKLSTFSSTIHSAGAVVEDERCAWTLDLTFSFEGDEVSSIAVHLVPRAGGGPMPATMLVAKVAAALGGSAFDRESGERAKGSRFERTAERQGVCKAFSRSDVAPHLDFATAMEPGVFLAHLWPHFGAPTPCDDGFEYDVVDRETGLGFTAYSGASGPSYGGPLHGRETLRPVIEAFEQMLAATTPVDCEVSFSADDEYGGGKWVLGFRDGRPYSHPRRG